jgi:hypothetical protein
MSQLWQRPGYEPVIVAREALGTGSGGLVWLQRVKDLGLGSVTGMLAIDRIRENPRLFGRPQEDGSRLKRAWASRKEAAQRWLTKIRDSQKPGDQKGLWRR